MSEMVVKIDELPDRLDELYKLVSAGTAVQIEHRDGHRVPLIFATPDPSILNPRPVVLGLHAGMIWMSDDFVDALPDEYWEGALD